MCRWQHPSVRGRIHHLTENCKIIPLASSNEEKRLRLTEAQISIPSGDTRNISAVGRRLNPYSIRMFHASEGGAKPACLGIECQSAHRHTSWRRVTPVQSVSRIRYAPAIAARNQFRKRTALERFEAFGRCQSPWSPQGDINFSLVSYYSCVRRRAQFPRGTISRVGFGAAVLET